jgi:hypothetical protein
VDARLRTNLLVRFRTATRQALRYRLEADAIRADGMNPAVRVRGNMGGNLGHASGAYKLVGGSVRRAIRDGASSCRGFFLRRRIRAGGVVSMARAQPVGPAKLVFWPRRAYADLGHSVRFLELSAHCRRSRV